MSNVTSYYSNFFKAWPGKQAGTKPTATELEAAHTLGARPGTKVAMALAMYLRAGGATQGQVTIVCGGPQLNKMRGLVEAGKAIKHAMPSNDTGHTVYHISVNNKPAKAVRKAVNRNARKVAARKPAAPVTEPAATPEAPEATPQG